MTRRNLLCRDVTPLLGVLGLARNKVSGEAYHLGRSDMVDAQKDKSSLTPLFIWNHI